MIAAITGHSKYLRKIESTSKVTMVMGAELVQAAIIDIRSQLVDLFLENLDIDGSAIDISNLLSMKTDLRYKPEWLSKILCGIDLQNCEPNPVKFIMESTYEQGDIQLKIIKILLENGASLDFDIPHTTILHLVIKLICKCADTDMGILHLVCKRFDFSSRTIVDEKGKTPWHIAIETQRTQTTTKICEVLSEYPIDPSLKDKKGKRADYQKRDCDKRVSILRKKEVQLKEEEEKKRAVTKTERKKKRKKKTAVNRSETPKGVAAPHNEPKGESQAAVATHSTSHLKEWHQLDAADTSTACEASGHHDKETENGAFINLVVHDSSIQESIRTHTHDVMFNYAPPTATVQISANKGCTSERIPKCNITYYLEKLHLCGDDYFQLERAEVAQRPTSPLNSNSGVSQPTPESKVVGATKDKSEESKQAEEFDFQNSVWNIECSKKVMKLLSGKKHKQIKKQFLLKMKWLSQGESWENPKHKKSVSTQKIFELRLNDKEKIMWQVVPQFHEAKKSDSGIYKEIIRVWDIVLDHDNIHHHVENIEKIINERSHAAPQETKVKLKCISSGASIEGSIRFPQMFEVCATGSGGLDEACMTELPPPINPEETSYSIARLYSLSDNVVKLMLEDGDIEKAFPYKEWPAEHDIINLGYDESILLLGRSGTGKTTCCLYRMWNEYKHYWSKLSLPDPDNQQACENITESLSCDMEQVTPENNNPDTKQSYVCNHLHQLFVTKNYVLCDRLRKQFCKFAEAEGIQHMQMKDREMSYGITSIDDLSYPLFLTARQFYIMLDYSLHDGEYFFKRDEKGHLTEKIISTDYDHEDIDTLLDFDDSEDDEIVHELYPLSKSQSEMKERREVTSSYFCTHIWKKISESKKENMSPVLVWMEIKSFIKGSREAIESNAGFLTKEEYIQLGNKAASNFRGNREKVYEIFEEYKLHMRNRLRENLFDECDFMHHLFRRIVKQGNKPQWTFHSIYIDEVQDFTQGELWLMMHNCMNPNGLFLTGDTAQSIMSGIAFRFEDVTTLFHHLKSKLQSKRNGIKVVVPKVRHLTVNFRAHSGILEIASSVTDILKEYFPNSFDHKNIPREEGLVSGPKPTLFYSCSLAFDIAMVLAKNKQTNTQLDFGAHQAILVRHQKAKENLPRDLHGVIALTIFESKGLEFDDVLLYNFFTDSDLSDEWRVLVSFTDKLYKQSKNEPRRPHPLTFTEEKHKQLCSELKHLYTAITRTKAKLWLYESANTCMPVLWYWKQCGNLVNVVDAKQLLEAGNSHEVFTSAATPEDWKMRGEEFMQHKLWNLAKNCFQRATLRDKIKYCEACEEFEHARECDKKARCLRFLSAATAFLKCDDIQHSPAALERAAACLYNGRRYEDAAWLYKRLSKTERAIKCYTLAKRYNECAKLMEDEHRYADALIFIAHLPEKVRAVEIASQYVKQKHVTCDEIPPSILRCGKKLARKYSGEELLVIIDAIPPKLQVQYLIKVEAFDRATKVLMDLEKYDDAHTLMLTQRMYKEAFNLAKKRHDTKKMQATLLNATRSKLCQCTEERAWYSEVPDLEKELQHMCETYTAPNNKGLGYILLSKLTGNDILCQMALESFQKDNNALGQCEALVLLVPQAQKDTKFIEEVVNACILTQKMCSTLKQHKQTATFTNVMLNFYGLTQVKNEQLYVLPWHQDVWGLCSKFDHNQPEPVHLYPHELHRAVSDHLERHIVTLMTNDSLYKPLIDIMETFEFHGKTMHGPFDHYCNQMAEYLTAYSTALEMIALTNSCPSNHDEVNSEDMRSFLLNLVKLNGVMMDKKHFAILERFPTVIGILESRLDSILKSGVSDMHPDDWMEMWLLSCVMKRDEKELNQITKPVPTHRLDGRSKHFFVSIPPEHSVPHFYLWIRFCQLVQEGDKAWIAIRVLTNYIETLAHRRSLNQHITCVSNTVYILSIATTIYLAFIKLSLPQQTIVVPKIIVTMMDCFNQMNSSQNCCESLLQSCSKTFKVLLANPQRTTAVKDEACAGLGRILSVFIGVYRENCNLLLSAISNKQQNNVVTCLVLGLTLLGNISLLTSYSPSDLLEYQKQMFSSLEPILKQPNHYLKNIHEQFACCQSSRDIFVLVQLLNKMYYGSSSETNTRDLYNFTVTKSGLNLIPISPDMVPKHPINRPTIEVESHNEACGPVGSEASHATSFERQSSRSSNEGDDELIGEDIKQALAYEEDSEETMDEQVERQPEIDKGFCRVCNISLASDTLSPVLSEHVSSENHKIKEREHTAYIQRKYILYSQYQFWEQEIQEWKNHLPESDQLEVIVKYHIRAVEDITRETEQNGKWKEGEGRFKKLQSYDAIEKSIKEGRKLVMKPKESETDPIMVIVQDPGQSDEETLPEMEDVKK